VTEVLKRLDSGFRQTKYAWKRVFLQTAKKRRRRLPHISWRPTIIRRPATLKRWRASKIWAA